MKMPGLMLNSLRRIFRDGTEGNSYSAVGQRACSASVRLRFWAGSGDAALARMTSHEKALRDFAQFAAKLKGDEKSEAQTFLFHLLAAFGHEANTLPEGCTFEYRVRFPGERAKFADLVWAGRCLIEMKSRGVKLSKHYQ